MVATVEVARVVEMAAVAMEAATVVVVMAAAMAVVVTVAVATVAVVKVAAEMARHAARRRESQRCVRYGLVLAEPPSRTHRQHHCN